MKIKEVIERINKKNPDLYAIDTLAKEFGIDIDYKKCDNGNTNLVSYWLECWYCTDTWVGTQFYFLDDKFIAYSTQNARKSRVRVYWASKEAICKTKKFIESYSCSHEDDLPLVNFDEDIGEGYQIDWTSELLTNTIFHDKCLYHGMLCEVDKEASKKMSRELYLSDKIALKDGVYESLVVGMREVGFPFNII
jgi:hypothetical protein